MSDGEQEDEKPFAVERAKTGRAKCKKCKCPIDKDQVRVAKLMANPFGEGKMKAWHHVSCIFEVFGKQRATTKRIEDPEEDISGWHQLCDADKDVVLAKLAEYEAAEPFKAAKAKAKAANTPTPMKKGTDGANASGSKKGDSGEKKTDVAKRPPARDDMFAEFQRVCNDLAGSPSYLDKTAIVKKLFKKGSEKDGFKSDVVLWCRLLLPGAIKRIYNLQSKALIKLFARLLYQDEKEMLEDLEQGDVAQTIKTFYEKSSLVKPISASELTLQEVDEFLEKLSTLTKEDEQIHHFKTILKRCTADDLKMIIRLIKHDLRINAGPKHILGAVHDDAYTAFQVSRDLFAVIERCLGASSSAVTPGTNKSPKVAKVATLALMTPVLPMLAEACKSVEMAMQKCPNGMLSEVKYDGERVQVHKMGNEFCYYSRSLKPVLPHKVNFLKDYIPKAFPEGDDLILDAEILLIDTRNGQPLPFGSLGVHKKAEFKDANVCLFVFDIIYYNGEPLMNRTMKQRRSLLEEKMTPITNRIMLSEIQEINDPKALAQMIAKVFKLRLEGLVLKDVDSKYEPGKRHWLKVKKDYLFQGAMADSADLVVLGAWYGTGQKGGIMSVFLMGCYDSDRDVWLTVTKVHTGHDDATLTELQTTLDMVKIGKDPNLLPKWLQAQKPMIPDFVARDPKKQPVWEITGAEFTNQGVHTADGISIRFPRVTRIRHDKDWQTATNLKELRALFTRSAESVDYSLLLGPSSDIKPSENDEKRPKKRPKKPHDSDAEDDPPEKKPRKPHDSDTEDDSPEKKPRKHHPRSASEKPSTSRRADESESSEIDTQVQMKISDEEKRQEVRGKSRADGKRTPKKSPGKLIAQSQRSRGDGDENRAEYYSFIGTDYIEYSAAGSPLNWIEGRKPPRRLPKDALPVAQRDDAKLRARCLLPHSRVYLAQDLPEDRRATIRRTLKTLGATILTAAEQSQATHVIHGSSLIFATSLAETEGVPKSARHVTESWIEATVDHCKVQNVADHAVTLTGVYCSCPCTHRG